MSRIAAIGLTLLVLAACTEGDDDGVTIDATGAVGGLVWLDSNGNTTLEGSDRALRDIRVELVPEAGGGPAYSGESGASGEFIIRDVLVGDYRAVVDASTVGDTLRILRVDSADVTVEAGDTAYVAVALTFPAVPIDSARRAATDTRLFVEGLVLTRWGAFGEAALHVRDTTGAIQAVRVQPTGVVPGDSVRILGATSIQTGQVVIKDGVTYLLRTGVESPPPDTVTTGTAATAADGALDADLVHLDSAVVQDSSRNLQGELVLQVDDGSGPVDVVFDRDIPFFLQFDEEVIGTILEVTGVLVPASPGGTWQVKPRSSSDVVVGPLSFPSLAIADARLEPDGTRLIVHGIALNGWTTFRDSTLHVRDPSGSIRAVRVPPSPTAAGDSVRVVASISSRDGQPVLSQAAVRTIQSADAPPEPRTVSAATAATADGAALDADLVVLRGAAVEDTARTSTGEFFLTVDDGSGSVDVVLDRDIAFTLDYSGSLLDATLDVTGLLVPDPDTAGRWLLKPRASADLEMAG